MAINYNYVDPKDMNPYQVIEPGEGTFKIVKVEEKVSRSNNPMMVVTFKLENARGQSTLANEYLVSSKDEAQNKSTATKIYNLLTGIGRTEFYGMPLEPKHIYNGRGKCIIKTHKSEDPQYADKSVISQYLPSTLDAPPNNNEIDEEIPF